jgi:exosortase/archaeosortase family protein
LCAIYFLGGRSWLRRFAFSICLIFAVIPWPGVAEDFIIQGLMQVATSVTVEVLNLFHVPALQHGNLIEIRTGLLGIDEACSGIRSLQATVMISLFLGELYRAAWRRRVVLILCGILIAFFCNVGRAFLLSWVAANDGIEVVAKWHDPAGFTILGACFLLLWGFARLLFGKPATVQPSAESVPRPLPYRLVIGLGASLLISVAGSETWYRVHETRETLRWSFGWPVAKEHFSDLAISKYAAGELRFDEGRAASWRENDGTRWTAFFFKWAAGPTRSRVLAHMHRPQDCLPGAGFKFEEDRGIITIEARGIDDSVPFVGVQLRWSASVRILLPLAG